MKTAAGRSVLLVDDDPEFRAAIGELLERHHYKVITADNGLEAIQKSNRQNVDVILLDIRLPIFSGYWFCDAFKRRPKTRNVPVIVISGLSEEEDIKKAYEVGASAYLTKPFESEALVRAIEQQLAA